MSDEHIKELTALRDKFSALNLPDTVAALDAAIAALEGWRPIESAPKDGTEVLACEGGERYVTSWCSFTDGFGEKHTGWIHPDKGELGPCTCDPTHWMPLPTPPTSADAKESV